jgi:ABC-type lipoprotein release transport system permease subunit
MRYELDLARSFMKSTGNKKFYHPHIVLSILGIAVGVAFLIFALSIYDGYVKKIETIIFSFYPQITLQTDNSKEEAQTGNDWLLEDEKEDDNCQKICNGEIIMEDKTLKKQGNSSKQGFDLKDFDGLKSKLHPVAGIKQVSPIIFEEADFTYTYTAGQETFPGRGPLRILGVQPQTRTFVPEIERTITEKSLLTTLARSDAHYVILSAELYKKLFGDSPTSSSKPMHKKIELQVKEKPGEQERIVELNVAGVFKLGMHKISENMMITSLAVAREIFSMDQSATFVGVSLENPYQAESIADQIKKITAQDHISTYHWMAVAADMFNSLSFYRKIVIIVLLMSILITAFNIYTTLNIMILERKRQIGVLMSMGIKKSSLYRVFLIVSQKEAIIGIVSGILLGVVLGYYFSDYFNRSLEAFLQIQEAGTVVHPGTAVFILGFVCLVCGLTAFAATRKGANLDPVEALRSE